VETEARHVLVGTATVIFAGAILATILWLAGVEPGGDRDRYVILFEEQVSGLEEGVAVRVNGVRVGSVERIRLRPDQPDTVNVTVAVRPDAPIADGSVAQLNPRGITGAQYVSVSAAAPDAPPLEERVDGMPLIPSQRSTMSRMLDRAPQILEDVSRATERIGEIFGDGDGDGDGTGALIASLTEAGDAAPSAIAAVESAATEVAQLARAGRDTLATADRTLAAAEETLSGTDALMAEEMPQLIGRAREAADALAGAAQAAERLIQRNDAPIARFARQGLAEVRHLVNEARLMVDALTQVAEMLEENPNAVIFGPAEGQFRPETRQ
jgi:phospholipid/cholesterol/gamma-HCH transport system substrate-binding protein